MKKIFIVALFILLNIHRLVLIVPVWLLAEFFCLLSRCTDKVADVLDKGSDKLWDCVRYLQNKLPIFKGNLVGSEDDE